LNQLETFSFGIFGKSLFNQIFVEQGKDQLLLEKPCHLSEKNVSKIRNSLWIFEFCFTILNSCSTKWAEMSFETPKKDLAGLREYDT
jgi:hypothetical protein